MNGLLMKSFMVLLLAVFIAGCGDDEVYDYPGSINVTGSGTAYAEPDIASIEFGVDLTENDPAEAVNQAAEMMNAAFAAASGFAIEDCDMMTTSYNMWVEEEYDYYTCEYTGETLYHVAHYARVDIRNLDSVGDVIAGLVEAGSNTVSSISFKVEDSQSLLNEARTLAVSDARRVAEQLASELGMEVGKATYVNEWIDYYPMYETGVLTADCASEISAPSISPGASSVNLKVQITFELI